MFKIFVAGEYLQFGLEIRNGASVKISRIKVSLKKVSLIT